MTYYTIAFLHDYEDEKALQFLDNAIENDEMIEYLSNWDFGTESECEPRDDTGIGTADNTYKKDNYILSWNTTCGYVSLTRAEKQTKEEER